MSEKLSAADDQKALTRTLEMENLKLFFQLYLKPISAISDFMDKGSWVYGAVAVLIAAGAFSATVNDKLNSEYRIKDFYEFYSPALESEVDDAASQKAILDQANTTFQNEMARRPRVPVMGDRFFWFFTIDPAKFYYALLLLSIFYVPTVILLVSIFGQIGSFGLVLRRDYGTLSVCTLSVWAAAHLPFAIVGGGFSAASVATEVYFTLWAASSIAFGAFMVLVLRTVFGAKYGLAIVIVSVSWLAMSMGMHLFQYVSPWLFSPFLLLYLIIYLGGSIGGEVRGFGNAFRQRQNLKRFLHNATVNPRDADAHVQLGIIYLGRRQRSKAMEHFDKAIEIDPQEIDANYELGKIARQDGDFQKAIHHFEVVFEQDDKHSLSEVWRETGATYLAADMLNEAHEALQKFVDRRSADVEGLYYLGKVFKAKGEIQKAREAFQEAVDSANASPDYRKYSVRQWSKLAQKEI